MPSQRGPLYFYHGLLGDLLAESFSLQIRGQGYVIGVQGEGTRVEYDGSVPLAEWLSAGADGQAEGNAP